MHDLFRLLDHRHLILAHRNRGSFERRDIRRLADRITEKSHRNARLEIPHLDLRLYRWISLKTGHRHQVHIIKGQFTELRNLRLDQQCGFCRIQTARQVIQRNLNDILAHLFRIIRIVRQRLRVRDHNKYFFVFP